MSVTIGMTFLSSHELFINESLDRINPGLLPVALGLAVMRPDRALEHAAAWAAPASC